MNPIEDLVNNSRLYRQILVYRAPISSNQIGTLKNLALDTTCAVVQSRRVLNRINIGGEIIE